MRELKVPKFVSLLEESGAIEPTLLNGLVSKFKDDHSGLMLEVLEKGLFRRDQLGEMWARALDCTYVNPLSINITAPEDARIPQEMAKRINAISLYEFEGYITLSMDDPTNRQMIESLERFLLKRVSPVFS